MSVIVDGTSGITTNSGTVVSTTDATLNGLTVGKGGGAVSTNTAVGASALSSNSTGYENTAIGYQALNANTSNANTAFGAYALKANTTGNTNTAIGDGALFANTTGISNTALGLNSLSANTTGGNNTSLGMQALNSNTTASYNTAVGYQALYTSNRTSDVNANNTALGYQAGYALTTGQNNTIVGYQALNSYTGAGGNTIIGYQSGNALTSGFNNTIIGGYTGNQGGLDIRTASNYIVLSDGAGNPNAIWTNNGYMRSIGVYNQTGAASANVIVNASGDIYRSTSALKYKQDIRDLEFIDITKFRPVRYKSKCEVDDQTKDHFGIVADEVHDAGITELVNYGADGQIEGFQYERLTVVLLKSLQELKTIVDAQAAEIAELKAKVG